MIATIIHWLTPDVIVELSRDSVEFRCVNRVERFKPVLWVAGEGRQQRLIAVGEKPALTEEVRRINLFDVGSSDNPDRERMEFLSAFFRYGLVKVLGRKFFGRPGVLARDPQRLFKVEGSLRDALNRSLEMAGAHNVRWE